MIMRALMELNPWRFEVRRFQRREVLRVGEGARAGRNVGRRLAAVGDEAIEQLDPDGKRQLLTGDAVNQCFEDGGKARGPDAPHTPRERAEQRV
jgi:hypothetical protein